MQNRKKLIAVLLMTVAAFGVLIGVLIRRGASRRGLEHVEQPISGEKVSFTQSICGRGCVYLPMVAANAGVARQADTNPPEAAIITVRAQASHACGDDAATPVAGARVTVLADSGSRVGVTDARGRALFDAMGEPAVVQIEWPVGLLPCPNSRPMVDLPSGAGEVTFMAVASPYP